jgi:voltage-gated potassium channel
MSLHIHHKKLITIALIFLASWIVGTFAVHYFEQGHPIGESYFNAFYFTVITTATIGFGDLVPFTVGGKIVTMMYAIFYVPLFLYVMTLLYQNNIERLRAHDRRLEDEIREVEADVEAIIDNEYTIRKSPRKKTIKK